VPTIGHDERVFVRWLRWSMAHRFMAGLASLAGAVGVPLLLV